MARDIGSVVAVLGPTNTGKTHHAIERMLGLASLVVHTAGTRMNAVRLAGMDAVRGREVRNDLIDRDGDDDDAV